MEIIIAIALSNRNTMPGTHFGDADKFLLYSLNENTCHPVSEVKNLYKKEDEKAVHGARKKGESIVTLLEAHNVSVLISQQFGPNVKIIARHFLPLIAKNESLKSVSATLLKNYRQIAGELATKKDTYSVFFMQNEMLNAKANGKLS